MNNSNDNGGSINTNLKDIDENEPNSNEDVMIKIVRVIANLAINEKAGCLLANKQDLFDILLKILGLNLKLKYQTCLQLNNLIKYIILFFRN